MSHYFIVTTMESKPRCGKRYIELDDSNETATFVTHRPVSLEALTVVTRENSKLKEDLKLLNAQLSVNRDAVRQLVKELVAINADDRSKMKKIRQVTRLRMKETTLLDEIEEMINELDESYVTVAYTDINPVNRAIRVNKKTGKIE